MIKRARIQTQAVPASFWKRVLAYLIDLLILDLVITLPFRDYFKKYESFKFQELLTSINDSTLGTIALIISILSLAYWTILEYKVHQTIGKMLLNISVTPKEATFTQILLRNITKTFQLALAVDVAYMFFKHHHQRLFERFSKTEVVEYTWKLN